MYRWVLLAITAVGLLGCFTFVLRYAILSRGAWLSTEAGRFMMITYGTLGTLFALIMTNQLLGFSWPGREPITVILFTIYVAFTWWPLRLLGQAREKRSSQRKGDSDGDV